MPSSNMAIYKAEISFLLTSLRDLFLQSHKSTTIVSKVDPFKNGKAKTGQNARIKRACKETFADLIQVVITKRT